MSDKRKQCVVTTAKVLFFLFLTAVWLFPFQELFVTAIVCAALIMPVSIAFVVKKTWIQAVVALAVAVMCSVYNERYLVCFAPLLFSSLLFVYAQTDKMNIPVRSDWFFFILCMAQWVFSVAALIRGIIRYTNQPDDFFTFRRRYVFLILAAAYFVFLIFESHRNEKKKKGESVKQKKLRYFYASVFCAMPAIFLFVCAKDLYVNCTLYPMFFIVSLPLLAKDPNLRNRLPELIPCESSDC